MRGIIERGSSFQVKKRIAGQNVTATFAVRGDAEAFILECEAAAKRGQPLPRPNGNVKDLKKGSLLDVYEATETLLWKRNKSRASTDAALLFLRWVGEKRPAQEAFAQETIDGYIKFRREEKGNCGCTINKKLSVIRQMAKVAHERKLISAMPVLPSQGRSVGRLRYFTKDEEAEILKMCDHLGMPEWKAFFAFLCDTGGRAGEVRQVRWQDIRGGKVTFEAPTTKTKTTRTVPLTKRALEEAKRFHNQHPKGPFQWASKGKIRDAWNKLRDHLKWMDTKEVVPYCFRHTCASRLAMSGASAPKIMAWMGHANITTTQRYMHLAPATLDGMTGLLEDFKDPE